MKWSTEAYSAFFTLFFRFVPHTVGKSFKFSALHRLLPASMPPPTLAQEWLPLSCYVHACTVAWLFNITAQGEW